MCFSCVNTCLLLMYLFLFPANQFLRNILLVILFFRVVFFSLVELNWCTWFTMVPHLPAHPHIWPLPCPGCSAAFTALLAPSFLSWLLPLSQALPLHRGTSCSHEDGGMPSYGRSSFHSIRRCCNVCFSKLHQKGFMLPSKLNKGWDVFIVFRTIW